MEGRMRKVDKSTHGRRGKNRMKKIEEKNNPETARDRPEKVEKQYRKKLEMRCEGTRVNIIDRYKHLYYHYSSCADPENVPSRADANLFFAREAGERGFKDLFFF